MSVEKLETLLSEIGPLVDSIQAIEKVAEATWNIEIEPELTITVEWMEDTSRLVFSSELAAVEEGTREVVLERMLNYNVLWTATDRATLAMLPLSNTAVLVADTWSEGLAKQDLAAFLEHFAGQAFIWRLTFEAGALDDDVELGGNASTAMTPGIRV